MIRRLLPFKYTYSPTTVVLWAALWGAVCVPAARPPQSVDAPCRPVFYSFDAQEPHPIASLQQLRSEYLGLAPMASRRDNSTYRRTFAHEAAGSHYVVNILFPVVGRLNKTLESKESTASLFNLYKNILNELIAHDIRFRSIIHSPDNQVIARYSDYKLLAFTFARDTAELRQALKELQKQAADRFWRATNFIPEMARLDESQVSVLQNRMAWFHWGTGSTGVEAWMAARAARFLAPDSGPMDIAPFSRDSVQTVVERRLEETEVIRKNFVARLSGFVNTPKSQAMLANLPDRPEKIPSAHLWDMIRGGLDGADPLADAARSREKIRGRFGVDLPDSLLLELRDYARHLEALQPMIFQPKEQMNLGVSKARHGVIYFDIRGQTSRNMFRAAGELARVANSSEPSLRSKAEQAIAAVHEGQVAESRRFQKLKGRIRQAVREVAIKATIHESGDELALCLDEKTSPARVNSLLASIADTGEAGNYRPIYVHPPSGAAGEQTDALLALSSNHVGLGELIEKNLRGRIEASKRFTVADLDKLMIAVEVFPHGEGAHVRLHLVEKWGSTVSKQILPWVKRLVADKNSPLLPEGYRFIGVTAQRQMGELPL